MTYQFIFTPEIVSSLQSIERSRAEVTLTVLPPALAEQMRFKARVRSTHYSTRSEGNRLTLAEAEQAILGGKARALSLSPRQVRDLLNQWSAQGWLVFSETSRKLRRYRLSAE